MSKNKLDTAGVPLVVENHPKQYKGFPFITYIQFHNSDVLALIDNVHNKQIQCYVLDLCQPEEIDEAALIEVASRWYADHSHRVPLSVFMNQLGLDSSSNKIYRTYNIEFITRIVGPLFTYPINEVVVTRRKKRKSPGPQQKPKVVSIA